MDGMASQGTLVSTGHPYFHRAGQSALEVQKQNKSRMIPGLGLFFFLTWWFYWVTDAKRTGGYTIRGFYDNLRLTYEPILWDYENEGVVTVMNQ